MPSNRFAVAVLALEKREFVVELFVTPALFVLRWGVKDDIWEAQVYRTSKRPTEKLGFKALQWINEKETVGGNPWKFAKEVV